MSHQVLTLRKNLNRELEPFEVDDNFEALQAHIDEVGLRNEYEFVAGENIGVDKALALINEEVFHFDINNQDHFDKCVGLSKNTGLSGAKIISTFEGIATTAGALAANKVYYINAAADLTTTPDFGKFFQRIGHSISTTQLFINLVSSRNKTISVVDLTGVSTITHNMNKIPVIEIYDNLLNHVFIPYQKDTSDPFNKIKFDLGAELFTGVFHFS